jgi:hypothetical protein
VAGGHEKVLALALVEGQQADRVARAKGAVAQRLDQVGHHVELAPLGAKMHRGRHVDHDVHGNRHAQPVDAHQPVAAALAHACAQVDAARVGMVEQPPVRGEFLPAALAQPTLRTRAPAAEATRQLVVEFVDAVHGIRGRRSCP